MYILRPTGAQKGGLTGPRGLKTKGFRLKGRSSRSVAACCSRVKVGKRASQLFHDLLGLLNTLYYGYIMVI